LASTNFHQLLARAIEKLHLTFDIALPKVPSIARQEKIVTPRTQLHREANSDGRFGSKVDAISAPTR
jgi:hypothetical protein